MSDMMNEIFGQGTTVDVETSAQGDGNEEKREKVRKMKEALKETIQTTPDFAQRLRRLSNSLEVVNTLGFGTGGNIVVDKSYKSTSKDDRKLKATSKIVGYKIKNIGNEPISYQTEVFAKDETGKFVGTVVDKTLAPGETTDLSRQYMTILCAQPEISFTLANGKIVASSKKGARNLKEELASYYFSFNKDENGNSLEVNDDEVKLSIDVNNVVKPEYEEVFGWLNNPKEGRVRSTSGQKFTTQDIAANYIAKLLKEQSL